MLFVVRVVGVVMRCLGEVQSEMAERCSSSDAAVSRYDRDMISPLVALTRSFVVAECAMSEHYYKQYFAVTDTATTPYRTGSPTALICSALAALTVAVCLDLFSSKWNQS